jgi:hypothetical protein
MFHTQQYVPEGQEDFWLMVFISYGVLLSVIMGNADIRNKLFDVTVVEFVPRFMLFFIPSLFIFYGIMNFVDPLQYTLFGILSNVPIWLMMTHALVFATIESAVWQGYLDQKVGHPWSELIAGIFHYGVWAGAAFIVIPSAALLFAIFSVANWYFRNSQKDLAPAIAVHTAFNFVKLGIFLTVV